MKKESQTSFNELCALYVGTFGTQRAFNTSKRYLLAMVQEHFRERRLSQITYLDLETYRNKRKATPARGGKPRTDASLNRDVKMTMRYVHLSPEHLRDSVNLLNDLPGGKEMVNIPPKAKKAGTPQIANPL